MSLLSWIEVHPGTASWAQAAGATAALVIAVYIPIWQTRRTAKENARQVAGKLRAIAAIGQRILASIRHDITEFDELGTHDANWWSVDVSTLVYDRYTVALTDIPLHSLPDDVAARAVIQMVESAQDCRTLITQAAIAVNDQVENIPAARMDVIRQSAHDLEQAIEQLTARAGEISRR